MSYTFGAPGVGAYLDGRAMLLEPLLLVGAFAALFALSISTTAYAHCGTCGPKAGKAKLVKKCKKKCAAKKAGKACVKKCVKKHKAKHKKK